MNSTRKLINKGQNEDKLKETLKASLQEAHFQGLKEGCKAILGTILEMCNDGKTVEDIKDYCEKSLGMEGMKDGSGTS